MPLRVSTTDSDVTLDDLGITVVHPTTNRDLSLEFTAVELRDSIDLTNAIQNDDLTADDGTFPVYSDDYDPDQQLIQELAFWQDLNVISHDELKSIGDVEIKSSTFPLALNSTASATRNVYSNVGRWITWWLQPGDIVVITGNDAVGTYHVESVTDQQNFIVVESIPDSTGGTTNIYHPGGASRIGVIDDDFTTISGQDVQTVFDSIDDTLETHTHTHASTTGQTTDDHHNEDHASRHISGGADAIKLDDLASPDDNTDLNSSSSKHGLLPKLSGDVDDTLQGDGTWSGPKAVSAYNSIFLIPVAPGATAFVPFDTTCFATPSSMHDATISDSGTATGSQTSTTLQDTTKSWTVDEFVGYTVQITGGTGSGQFRQITSNTTNTLTVAAWSVTPDSTSTYRITELSTRLVAPEAGFYQVIGHSSIQYEAGALGVYLYINGSFKSLHYQHQGTTVELNCQHVRMFELEANDYVEMKVYNGDSVSRNLFSGECRLLLQMVKVR